MKIGIIIPDRGDRPELMKNCLRMMEAQTLQPQFKVVVSEPPASDACDITWRYRKAYEVMTKLHVLGCGFNGPELIAFIENDDWYAPDYLEVMARAWEDHGRPDIFGTNYTVYYHLKLRRYFIFEHFDRASMMNTVIKPGLNINWCADSDPYTDMWLWGSCGLKSATFKPARHISMGMKHGEGRSGGEFHTNLFDYFKEEDGGLLQRALDPVSFEFYDRIFK